MIAGMQYLLRLPHPLRDRWPDRPRTIERAVRLENSQGLTYRHIEHFSCGAASNHETLISRSLSFASLALSPPRVTCLFCLVDQFNQRILKLPSQDLNRL